MATTPGQGVPGGGQQSVPSMVGIASTVQRVEVPVNAIAAGSGTTMVRVSQPTAPGSVVGASGMVARPQIVTTTPGGGHGTIFQTPVGNLQSLGLMVTRFPTGDHTRPQIILQSRSGAPVRSGPVVVTSTGGQVVHQTPLARTPVGTSGIRTAIVQSGSVGGGGGGGGVPGHGHGVIGTSGGGSGSSGTIQVMNLSGVGSSGSQVTKLNQVQQGGTTFISRFGGQTFEGQTVNFILSDTNRGAIRLSSDLIKTVQPGGKYGRVQGVGATPKILNLGPAVSVSGTAIGVGGSMVGGSGGVVGGSGSVIGGSGSVIGGSGSVIGGGNQSQVTRVNIIQSGGSNVTSGNQVVVGGSGICGQNTQVVGVGKQGGVINIAPVGTSKPGQQTVILNPATNQFMTGATPGGNKIGGQGVKTTVVAMNQGGVIGGQSIHGSHPGHTVINASGLRGITTVPSTIGTVGVPGTTIGIVSQNSSSIHRHASVVAMNASPIKSSTTLIGPHVQSSVTGSPIKPHNFLPTHAPTPPSPRPSILTRKRNLGDGPSNLARSPMKGSIAEGLAAKVEAELVTCDSGISLNPPPSNILTPSDPSTLPSIPSSIPPSTITATQPNSNSSDGTTPRKKPRKQLLEPFNLSTSANIKLLTTGTSDEPTHFPPTSTLSKDTSTLSKDSFSLSKDPFTLSKDSSTASKAQIQIEECDESMLRTTELDPLLGKKFRPALYQSVIPPWKSLQHHFLRYTDVKPRQEKRMTLAELSNEGLQKKNGWKIHHLATQMEEMGEDEAQVLDRLRKLLSVLEQKSSIVPSGFHLKHFNPSSQPPFNGNPQTDPSQNPQSDLSQNSVKLQTPEKVIDLIRGNLQRSNIFKEQMNESQQLLVKLTNDHREKVAKLTKKNMHKRTCIAK